MMRLLSLIGFVLMSLALSAQLSSFESANKAYKDGDFATAVSSYEQLISEGNASKEVHYNIANAYYKNSQLGHAILHYEKALKLDPSDKNIKGNLEIANGEIELEILEVPPFFVFRVWRGLYSIFSSTVWVILQVVLVLAILYGLYLWSLSRVNTSKLKGLRLIGILLPLLFIAYFCGRAAHHQETAQDDGIILQSANLTSDPLEKSETLEELTPGVKVMILDKVDTWYKVSLVNKAQGWVQKDVVGLI